jgi:hypothetical protein
LQKLLRPLCRQSICAVCKKGEQLKEHIKVHQQFAENKGVNYSLKRHGSVVAGENGEIIDFSSPVSTQRREKPRESIEERSIKLKQNDFYA